MNATKFQMAKLNDQNYQPWNFKVKMLLVREETWKCVENETPDHPDDEWIQSDLKVQSTISLSVGDSQIVHISKCE